MQRSIKGTWLDTEAELTAKQHAREYSNVLPYYKLISISAKADSKLSGGYSLSNAPTRTNFSLGIDHVWVADAKFNLKYECVGSIPDVMGPAPETSFQVDFRMSSMTTVNRCRMPSVVPAWLSSNGQPYVQVPGMLDTLAMICDDGHADEAQVLAFLDDLKSKHTAPEWSAICLSAVFCFQKKPVVQRVAPTAVVDFLMDGWDSSTMATLVWFYNSGMLETVMPKRGSTFSFGYASKLISGASISFGSRVSLFIASLGTQMQSVSNDSATDPDFNLFWYVLSRLPIAKLNGTTHTSSAESSCQQLVRAMRLAPDDTKFIMGPMLLIALGRQLTTGGGRDKPPYVRPDTPDVTMAVIRAVSRNQSADPKGELARFPVPGIEMYFGGQSMRDLLNPIMSACRTISNNVVTALGKSELMARQSFSDVGFSCIRETIARDPVGADAVGSDLSRSTFIKVLTQYTRYVMINQLYAIEWGFLIGACGKLPAGECPRDPKQLSVFVRNAMKPSIKMFTVFGTDGFKEPM